MIYINTLKFSIVLIFVFSISGCNKEHNISDSNLNDLGVIDQYDNLSNYIQSDSNITDEEISKLIQIHPIFLKEIDMDINNFKVLPEEIQERYPKLLDMPKIIEHHYQNSMSPDFVDEYIEVKDLINSYEENNQAKKSSFNSANFLYVPHYYEFDASENPNGYYWCAHASLKCVGKYHGKFKTLTQIHNYFYNNSAGYSDDRCGDGRYCGSYEDMLVAAKGSNFYKYRRTSKDGMSSKSKYLQKLVDGVKYNKPVIAVSDYKVPYGHFYPVSGYAIKLKNGKIDYDKSYFLLRNVLKEEQIHKYYDEIVTFNEFYNHRESNNLLVVRK